MRAGTGRSHALTQWRQSSQRTVFPLTMSVLSSMAVGNRVTRNSRPVRRFRP